MNFNTHLDLEGEHAFLSPSKYHWINYTDEKLTECFFNNKQVERGTELHELACRLIKLGIKLPDEDATLNKYVNDALGYRMEPERPLAYSPNCFGTADAICFRKGVLRIHDLKTGVTPASLIQLRIYAALYCLEYKEKPEKIKIVLRIYQNNEVQEEEADSDDIRRIMDKIVHFDKLIEKLKQEV